MSGEAGACSPIFRASFCGIIICVLAWHADAQLAPDDSYWRPDAEAELDACLSDENGDRSACIGIVRRACPDVNVDTASTVRCLQAEFEAWQSRLDRAFAELSDGLASADAEQDEAGPYRLAVTVEGVQSNWAAWRDAECGFAYAKYRGGSMGRVDRMSCLSTMTAERYFTISDLLEEIVS